MDPSFTIAEPKLYLPLGTISLRLLLALICGAAIGFEREWSNHSAGLRTHILVSLSAAIFAILAIEITYAHTFGDQSVRIDPIRLIEAITSGVAFLAAGMIAFSKGQVTGLTTGAGMWLAGAIGLAAGLGFWQIAVIASLFAIVVLWLLGYLEKQISKTQD